MRRMFVALLASCLALSLATTAQAQPATPASTVKLTEDAKLGKYLTDDKGMTLYMFTRDTADTSNCYDACATRWPPLLLQGTAQPVAPAGLTGTLGATTRKDGARQASYNGMPLYLFSGDTKVGDTNGQNSGTVWFVVAPGATFASFPAPPPPAQPATAAPAPAAAPVAAPASQPAQLPRTGEAPVEAGLLALGLALGVLGLALRRRATRA